MRKVLIQVAMGLGGLVAYYVLAVYVAQWVGSIWLGCGVFTAIAYLPEARLGFSAYMVEGYLSFMAWPYLLVRRYVNGTLRVPAKNMNIIFSMFIMVTSLLGLWATYGHFGPWSVVAWLTIGAVLAAVSNLPELTQDGVVPVWLDLLFCMLCWPWYAAAATRNWMRGR